MGVVRSKNGVSIRLTEKRWFHITDDDIIIRYEKGDIVGITILNASRRKIGHGHGV
jgi:uncharacterized protein YuzE